ncbi:MAG: ROK family transcriptional regulator [Polyangiaceae bacterium]
MASSNVLSTRTGPRGMPNASGTVRAANIRAHNRAIVLEMVWWEQSISRAEIARRTGLSRSTVSNITDELFETGLLRNAGEGQSIGGKPPKLLGFNDDRYGILGVELGATHIGVVLTNLRGRIVHWERVEHDVRGDPEGTLEQLFALITEAAHRRERGMRRVVGIGVAVPTPVDPAKPNAFSPRVLPKWGDVRLSDALEARFGVPVVVDNDANLGALAECWWGAGRNGRDLAFIKLGTGIGCGFVINQEIHRGATFLAGELGHLAIQRDGPLCDCGRPGCLVKYLGRAAVLDRARELCASPPASIPELIAAAERGEEGATTVLAEAAEHLAVAVVNLVNLVNPATVVFGGGLSGAGERLLAPISAALLSRYQWASDAKTNLVVSSLGESGIALGAATAVLARALKEPALFENKLAA